MDLKEIFVVAVLLVVVAGAQIFDVFGEPDKTEFGLEIDEVYLTDLELAPVTTHYMRQGKWSIPTLPTTYMRESK